MMTAEVDAAKVRCERAADASFSAGSGNMSNPGELSSNDTARARGDHVKGSDRSHVSSTAGNGGHKACPVCGGPLEEIRAKLQCRRCHAIIETCCEEGPQ
jgi:hypothetical protein